jgi:hypothetical protein
VAPDWTEFCHPCHVYVIKAVKSLGITISATTEEWDKITLDEIRKRTAEMPARCEKLVATGGERIRSKVW